MYIIPTVLFAYLSALVIERSLFFARSRRSIYSNFFQDLVEIDKTRRDGEEKYGEGIVTRKTGMFAHLMLSKIKCDISYIPLDKIGELKNQSDNLFYPETDRYNLEGLNLNQIFKRVADKDAFVFAELIYEPFELFESIPVPFAYRPYWYVRAFDSTTGSVQEEKTVADVLGDISQKSSAADN